MSLKMLLKSFVRRGAVKSRKKGGARAMTLFMSVAGIDATSFLAKWTFISSTKSVLGTSDLSVKASQEPKACKTSDFVGSHDSKESVINADDGISQ